MDNKRLENELNIAVREFQETFKAFEKVAQRLMVLMECMRQERRKEFKALSSDTQRLHEFLVQTMDDSGEIVEKCFGVRCVADREKIEE
ncbi:MAG: hypothetical protein HQ561_07230 [Desulfobacteraceae bacterium]|nr:hypothetical protein [Desulfobacteraceae bacterium]